jgi:hypothetical protein
LHSGLAVSQNYSQNYPTSPPKTNYTEGVQQKPIQNTSRKFNLTASEFDCMGRAEWVLNSMVMVSGHQTKQSPEFDVICRI